MNKNIRVALSKPCTARYDVQGALQYSQVADEAMASYQWGQKLKQPYGEQAAQASVVWALLSNRRRVDALVLGRYAEMILLLQALFPFGRRPALLLDTEWMLRDRKPLHQWVGKVFRRMIARGASKIQVFCEAEAHLYSKFYGIPVEKFVWIPYCPADETSKEQIPESDYIFTGGLHDRDFETMYHAVKDLPVEVRVAVPTNHVPQKFISPNMRILGRMPREEYFRQLTGSKLVFLCLEPVVRCPGVITYVYAMKVGKAVVVNEPVGAPSYIKHGETGLIVPSKDPTALRDGIAQLLNDEPLRKSIAERARADVEQRFTPAAYWRYLDEAIAALSSRR